MVVLFLLIDGSSEGDGTGPEVSSRVLVGTFKVVLERPREGALSSTTGSVRRVKVCAVPQG